MSALRSMGVRYNMDPFSLGGSDQHILLPEDVIEQRSGLWDADQICHGKPSLTASPP